MWCGTRARVRRGESGAGAGLGPAGIYRLAVLLGVCAGNWNQTVRSNASVLWGAGTARLLASA